MAIVHFSAPQALHTEGVRQLTVDAPRVHELIAKLRARFPGLLNELEHLAIAIDGEIRHDAAYEPLTSDSEIYFVPKIAGG